MSAPEAESSRRDSGADMDIRSSYQKAGHLYKLPMSKAQSDKWQRRFFVAKDGFLLYYAQMSTEDVAYFDTKPKGVIPLGGCKVVTVARGPSKTSQFGLLITHPDFASGRTLVLAAESEIAQKEWLEALNDCGRVTMENAKLGDAMIEQLRSAGATAEKHALETLQKRLLQVKEEQEATSAAAEAELQRKTEAAKAALEEKQKEISSQVSAAEARAAAAEGELATLRAQLQQQHEEKTASITQQLIEAQQQTATLSESKAALEAEVASLASARTELSEVKERTAALEAKAAEAASSITELQRERTLRRRLERKLAMAEDSLKRLDEALRKSGHKLDIEIFADVQKLRGFFEEKVDEVRRDAQRIELMKRALKAKKQYLVESAATEGKDDKAAAEAIAAELAAAEAEEEELERELADLAAAEGK